MFGKDFYPTPENVIDMMMSGVDVYDKIVLEPSAGKGNIVDWLHLSGVKEVLTCEIEPNLAKIVGTKSRLIASDFMSLNKEDISHIDLIVMNPPFSSDDKHILHAWDIAPDGCKIISLCNWNTIINTSTKSRKVLSETINDNGFWDDFGDCFSYAERQTGVHVACVHLNKKSAGSNEFDGYFDMDPEMEAAQEGILRYDFIRDVVSRYVKAVSMYDEVMDASNKINELTDPIRKYGIKFGAYHTGHDKSNYTTITRDVYKKQLQKECWNWVFSKMNMDKYVTTGVKSTINNFVERQEHVPFTVKNVYKMIEMVVGTHGSRMNEVLVEAFERICSFSADNSTAGETWKTNSNYMINKRFIIPYIAESDFYGSKREHVHLSYRGGESMDDILKGLCHLTGTNYDDITNLRDFVRQNELEWGKWHAWEPFFRIRGYKKGTMHFDFLDDEVYINFNKRVTEIKGWDWRLPNNSRSHKKR